MTLRNVSGKLLCMSFLLLMAPSCDEEDDDSRNRPHRTPTHCVPFTIDSHLGGDDCVPHVEPPLVLQIGDTTVGNGPGAEFGLGDTTTGSTSSNGLPATDGAGSGVPDSDIDKLLGNDSCSPGPSTPDGPPLDRATPEPTTVILLGAGTAVAFVSGRRRRVHRSR